MSLQRAFQFIDHDKDGSITEHDLRHTLGHGPLPTHDGELTLPIYLTMMSDRLSQFDPVSDLIHAFESFDDNDSGLVKVDEMRKWLTDVGERMDPHEIDKFFKGPFTDRHGNFNYREWIRVLAVNDDAEHA